MKQPASIKANQPSQWRSKDEAADLVVITRGDFFAALAVLKRSREDQGYKVDNLRSIVHSPRLEKKQRLIRTTEDLYVPLAARTNRYLHDELRRSLDKARSQVGSAD